MENYSFVTKTHRVHRYPKFDKLALAFEFFDSLDHFFTNEFDGAFHFVIRRNELLGGEKVHIPKRPGEPDCTFANITNIERDLQWQPQVSIEQGVAEILKNIDYWREAPVWTPDKIATATQDWFRYLGRYS